MFVDKLGDNVFLFVLLFLRDFEKARSLSWRSAVLASLHATSATSSLIANHFIGVNSSSYIMTRHFINNFFCYFNIHRSTNY